MLIKVIFCAGAALALGGPARGEDGGFLDAGPGAAARALGGAYTALAEDASAIYYNPAALPRQRGSITLEHVPVYAGGRLNFLGLAYPSRIGAFGVGLMQFSMGGIEQRAAITDAPTGINAAQTAYFFSFGHDFGILSLGATAKAVNYSFGPNSATGFGADVAERNVIFRGDTRLISDITATLGASVKNLMQPTLTVYRNAESLRRSYSLGLAVSGFVREAYVFSKDVVSRDRVTMVCEASARDRDRLPDIMAGLEYSLRQEFALRLGFNGNLTTGVGLGGKNWPFRIDYSAELAPLAPQHRFTVAWLFTQPPAQAESSVRLSPYRLAVQDQQRLKARFLKEGRDALSQSSYGEAVSAFEKARLLDLEDGETAVLTRTSREGHELNRIKSGLDAARSALQAGQAGAAAAAAFNAVSFAPHNPEAAEQLVSLRNRAVSISSEAAAAFESARLATLERAIAEFRRAAGERNIHLMRKALAQAKALHPDGEALWHPVQAELSAAERDWFALYLASAAVQISAQDLEPAARNLRRAARISPEDPALRRQASALRRATRGRQAGLYNQRYQEQLYYAAAMDYTLSDIESAKAKLTALFAVNPLHPHGCALLDVMLQRAELSFDSEP